VIAWRDDGMPKSTALADAVELHVANGTVCARDREGAVRCVGVALPCATPQPVAPKPEKPDKPEKPSKPAKPTKPTKPAKPAKPTKVGKGKRPPVEAPKPPPDPFDLVFTIELPKAKLLALDGGWCAVSEAGRMQCGDGCKPSMPLRGLEKVAEVSGTCARLGDGGVACWNGRDVHPIEGVSRAQAIAADGTLGCALLDGGAVTCWDAAFHATPVELH
jgi:hypothetical protein